MEVRVQKVIEDAEDGFMKGFFCSEAVMDSIYRNYGYSTDVVKLASGFRGGLASGCICGALDGAVMAIDMVFDRSYRAEHSDPRSVKCDALAHELHDWFKEANGKHSTCCCVLIREFDTSKGELMP